LIVRIPPLELDRDATMIANGLDPAEVDEEGNPVQPELLQLDEPLKKVFKP